MKKFKISYNSDIETYTHIEGINYLTNVLEIDVEDAFLLTHIKERILNAKHRAKFHVVSGGIECTMKQLMGDMGIKISKEEFEINIERLVKLKWITQFMVGKTATEEVIYLFKAEEWENTIRE